MTTMRERLDVSFIEQFEQEHRDGLRSILISRNYDGDMESCIDECVAELLDSEIPEEELLEMDKSADDLYNTARALMESK